jgi:hypothetical protein
MDEVTFGSGGGCGLNLTSKGSGLASTMTGASTLSGILKSLKSLIRKL